MGKQITEALIKTILYRTLVILVYSYLLGYKTALAMAILSTLIYFIYEYVYEKTKVIINANKNR